MRYLSPEWIDAARDALAADPTLPRILAGVTLTIEQAVDGVLDGPGDRTDAGPADGTARWHIAIDDGRVALSAGPADHPDLRFSTTYGTAAQIAEGTLAAQRAFVEGRLRVGGDLALLLTHQRAVAALDDALAGVRARTTYE